MDTISAVRAAHHAPTVVANGAAPAVKASTPVEAEALLAKLGQELGARATVDAVFGRPQTIGERTVIPVARIAYDFGGGAGGGARGKRRKAERAPEPEAGTSHPAEPKGEEVRAPQEFGVGGGGGVRAEPVAVVEIGPKGVRVVPIVDVNRMIGRVFTVVFGFAFAAMVVSAATSKTQGSGRRQTRLLPALQAAAAAKITSIVLRRVLTRVRRGRKRGA
jgi:uncharacterized spore protein YtfJ